MANEANTNDAMWQALRDLDYTGSVNDMYRQLLQDETGVVNINDAEYDFYNINLNITNPKGRVDKVDKDLTDKGNKGGVSDKKRPYWAGGGPQLTPTDPNFANVSLLVQNGSGSTIIDRSSFASSTTITGGAIWASDQTLFGVNTIKASQIMPNITPFSVSGANNKFMRQTGEAFTIEVWFRWNSVSNTEPSASILRWENPAGNMYQLALTGVSGQLYEVSGVTRSDLTVLPANTWHFIQLVVDTSNTYNIYVNGTSRRSATFSNNSNTGTWNFYVASINSSNSNSATYWVGPLRVTRNVARPNVVPTDLFPTA